MARSASADAPSTGARRPRARATWAGLLLGMGLGGFVDGIVLHQLLQWHHLLTDHGDHAAFPDRTVESLQVNMRADGWFHAATWVLVVVGVVLLWQVLSAGYRLGWRALLGLLLVGWGLFNVVEGIIDHHLLTIHHVRDDVVHPLWWDLAFLAFGAALIVVGTWLRRRDPLEASGTPA